MFYKHNFLFLYHKVATSTTSFSGSRITSYILTSSHCFTELPSLAGFLFLICLLFDERFHSFASRMYALSGEVIL